MRNPSASTPTTEDELIRQHLSLVDHVVTSFRGRLPRFVNADDLTSAAMHGLLLAARTFDEGRGVPFGAYASTRMRGAILDELRSADWASRNLRAKERALRAVADTSGTSLSEAAAGAGMTVDEARRVAADVRRAKLVSVEALVSGDHAASALPVDRATPEGDLLDRERMGYVHDAVNALPERMRRVVIETYINERPLAELAEEFGVSESRISHMRAEATSLMREAIARTLDAEEGDAPLSTGKGVAARRRTAYCDAVAARSDYRRRLDRSAPLAEPVPA